MKHIDENIVVIIWGLSTVFTRIQCTISALDISCNDCLSDIFALRWDQRRNSNGSKIPVICLIDPVLKCLELFMLSDWFSNKPLVRLLPMSNFSTKTFWIWKEVRNFATNIIRGPLFNPAKELRNFDLGCWSKSGLSIWWNDHLIAQNRFFEWNLRSFWAYLWKLFWFCPSSTV